MTTILAAALAAALIALTIVTRLLTHARAALLTDQLTGLANRTALYNRLDRPGGLTVVALIDLDRFKQVNDIHGHDTGDQVLREVAQRLAAAVPAGGMVARLGGDEFAAVWPLDHTPAAAVGAAIVATITKPILVNGHTLRVGASVGVTTSLHEPGGAALHRADRAMYRAKQRPDRVALLDDVSPVPQPRPVERVRDRHRARRWLHLNGARPPVARDVRDRARWSA